MITIDTQQMDVQPTPTPTDTSPVVNSTPEPVVQNDNAQVVSQPESQVVTQPASTDNNSFTSADQNTLTPQDQEAYKNMQADYTRKMQEISQLKQQYAQYEPVIKALQQQQNPQSQVNPVVENIVSQLKEAGYDESTIEVGKMISDSIIQHFNQTRTQEQVYNNVVNTFAEAVKSDPRLEDPNLVYDIDGEKQTFGQVVEKLVGADPNWTQNPQGAVSKAIKTVDAMINSAKQQGKQELSQKTQVKAQNFAPTNSSPQGAVTGDKPMSIREAFEAAKQQLSAS